MPGEMLAHPCPPEPRVDATGTGTEKKGHVQHVTTGARWPLQGDGLVLKHSKTPAKCALDQRDPGKEPFRGCTEHSFGPKRCAVMWGLSIPVQLPPCLLQLQHRSLLQHPHPAATGLRGCAPTPAAGQCQRDLGMPQHAQSPQTTASPATLKSFSWKARSVYPSPHIHTPGQQDMAGGKDEDKGAAGLGRDHQHQGLPKDTPKPQDMQPDCPAHITPTQTSGVSPYPSPQPPADPHSPPSCPSSEDGC